jgi:hypothetical protein
LVEAVTLSGVVDALVDSAPHRVVVGNGTVDTGGVSAVAGLWRAVECPVDVGVGGPSGGGGLVDPVSGECLGEYVERHQVVFRRSKAWLVCRPRVIDV